MTNFLIFPEINDENGFPPLVNSAIAQSPEMQAEMDERLGPSDTAIASFISDTNSATSMELNAAIDDRIELAGGGGGGASVAQAVTAVGAVFRATLAEAEAASALYGVPGYVETEPVEGTVNVTPAAPTFNDNNETYTLASVEGYDYYVDGVHKGPGTYSVTAPRTLTVTASPWPGRILLGTTSWPFSFTTNPSTVTTAYGLAVMADAPMHYWTLNEASLPLVGHGLQPVNLTEAGGTNITYAATGLGDGAASLSANRTGWVGSASSPAAFMAGKSSYTLEAIVNRGDILGDMASFIAIGEGVNYVEFAIHASKLSLRRGRVGGWDVAQSGAVITQGTTFHIAVTATTSEIKFYLNGVQSGPTLNAATVSALFTTPLNASMLGEITIMQSATRTVLNGYAGRLAGLAVYDKVVSAERLLAHHQARTA